MSRITTTRQTPAIRAAAVCWLVALALIVTAPAVAQREVTTGHHYTFGQAATFFITLPAASTAAEATIYLEIDKRTQAYTVPLDEGHGQYLRDLRVNPMPPFAAVTYWWQYNDATGKEQHIAGDTFLYEDNRFDWKAQRDGGIEVKWVSGDRSVMIRAIDIAKETALRIQGTLDTAPLDAVTIYIYPSLPDLQSALRLTGREWVGGQAYPEYGVVLVTMPPSDEAILKMQRDIPHELTHKMLYDLTTPQNYANIPAWLNEGLATYYESLPDPAFELSLKQATDAGRLIPMETLCHPFTGEYEDILLAYAQSQSFLRYLQQTYGWTKLRELVDSYAIGLDCVTGSEDALDANLSQLDRDWRAWLAREADVTDTPITTEALAAMVHDLAPWLLLLGILFLPGVAFWFGTR